MFKFRLAFAILFFSVALVFGSAIAQAAVTLENFEGSWGGTSVTLIFSTGSEIDHAGFHVWRSTQDLSPDEVNASNSTRLTTSLIRGNSCEAQGFEYEYSDTTVQSSQGTYYYYLESQGCTGSASEFFGDQSNPDGGLGINNPSAPASTPTPTRTVTQAPNVTVSATATTAPNATQTPEPTTAPNQPTNTPGPTGTLIPQATDIPPSATPAPTNTTAPQATAAATQVQPTQAPQPTDAPQATTAPQPTTADVPTTAPVEQPTQANTEPVATNTTEPIAAVISPVATDEALGGDMTQNDAAATPTLSGAITLQDGATGINGSPDVSTEVLSQTEDDGVDRIVQGLIAVILVGVVGLAGFMGWSYMRQRQ